MLFDKQQVIDLMKKEGNSQQVQQAINELPAKIDHEQHAQMLEKFGIDPGKLLAAAADKELGAGTPSPSSG